MEKPILFNTPMTQAILEDRKTQTRRICKSINSFTCDVDGTIQHEFIKDDAGIVCRHCGYGVSFPHGRYPVGTSFIRPPYQVGDVLYIRETWCNINKPGIAPEYYYYADAIQQEDFDPKEWKWKPSIHMPRSAARIFLKVANVKIERLQDITEDDAISEGALTVPNTKEYQEKFDYAVKNKLKPPLGETPRQKYERLWDSIYAQPVPVKSKGIITHYESYPWEDVQETKEYKGKPWIVCGNPWLWVYKFERTV